MPKPAFHKIANTRLEIETTPAGLPNLAQNPSGAKGGWAYLTPVANTAMGGTGSTLVFNTDPSQACHFTTEHLPLAATRWAAARIDITAITASHNLKLRFEWFDAAKVLLSSSTQTGAFTTGTNYLTAVQAPANTAYVKLRADFYNGAGNPSAGASVTLNKVMVAWATTSGPLAGSFAYADPITWANILAPTHEIGIERATLNAGTLTATIIDAALDPATSAEIAVGKAVRVTGLDLFGNYEEVFTGRVTNANVTYETDLAAGTTYTVITLTAVDNDAPLANQAEPQGVETVAELPYLLEGKGVPWSCDGSGNQVGSAVIVATNENTSVLDQIAITRDSNLGTAAWVDRKGVAQVWSPRGTINGTFATDVDGWTCPTATLARDTGLFRSAPASMKVTSTAVAALTISSDLIRIRGGKSYTVDWFGRAAATPRGWSGYLRFFNAAGTLIYTQSHGTITTTTSGWTAMPTMIWPAPLGAAYLQVVLITSGSVASGEIHYVDDLTLVEAPAVTMTDVPNAGNSFDHYTAIDVGYNTDDLINQVDVRWLRYNPTLGTTEEVAYGPYLDAPSVQANGPHPKTFTIQGATESPAAIDAYAAAILASAKTPTRTVAGLTMPVDSARGLHHAARLDLNDRVAVVYDTLINGTYEITGIRHRIDTDKWLVDYTFGVAGAVASPTLTPSPGPSGGGQTLAQILRPVGEVTMFGGASGSVPAGWLVCDGSTFSSATYPALATLLGGTTLPDLRDRLPIGASGTKALLTTGGSATKTIVQSDLPNVTMRGSTNEGTSTTAFQTGGAFNTTVTPIIGTTGTPMDIMPPWRALHFIIRAT